jgi:hypothetical protein
LGGFARDDDYFQEYYRSSTRIASGTPHNFPDAHSKPASRLSHHAMTRPPPSPEESISDFLRSVEGQQKQAMREETQQLVLPSAMPALLSQALTSH